MAGYIEKQAAIESALAAVPRDEYYDRQIEVFINLIPPADVRPVVRGEWLKSPECPEEYDICSVCGLNDKHRSRGDAEHPALESIPPFCKWCGADMRPIPGDGANERSE